MPRTPQVTTPTKTTNTTATPIQKNMVPG
jgi:hypothetical protein